MDPGPFTPARPAFLVVNPRRVARPQELQRLATAIARRNGQPAPQILFTTPADSGGGRARDALASGASCVVACGGDGTVRAVASALAGSGVPLGVVPVGTGNLFARNLALPVYRRRECLEIALTGTARPVDAGWLQLPGGAEHLFLVVAGIGLDADMVAGAGETLKRRAGWLAYFLAALPRLPRRMDVHLTIDGARRTRPLRARTVMVANVARLPLGLSLAPHARFDDGLLDVLSVETRGGPLGWISLGAKVALQGFGFPAPPSLASQIASRTGKRVSIRVSEERQVQVDGELAGVSRSIRARIAEGALMVRT